MHTKTAGYILLGVGIIIMLVAAFQVYTVFTGKSEPTSLFNAKGLSLDPQTLLSGMSDIPTSALSKSKPLEVFSPKDFNKTLNMTSHFFLMSFILGLGFKLSSLGVMLLRPVEVKMKEQTPQIPLTPQKTS